MNLGLIWTKDVNSYGNITGDKSTESGCIQVKDADDVVKGQAYFHGVMRSVGSGTTVANDEVCNFGFGYAED